MTDISRIQITVEIMGSEDVRFLQPGSRWEVVDQDGFTARLQLCALLEDRIRTMSNGREIECD